MNRMVSRQCAGWIRAATTPSCSFSWIISEISFYYLLLSYIVVIFISFLSLFKGNFNSFADFNLNCSFPTIIHILTAAAGIIPVKINIRGVLKYFWELMFLLFEASHLQKKFIIYQLSSLNTRFKWTQIY